MTVVVQSEAELDLADVFEHYESTRPGLGHEFIDSFRGAVSRILQFPRGWQSLDATYRRCRLSRFPYGIIYRIDEGRTEIVIVGVMHLARRPRQWPVV